MKTITVADTLEMSVEERIELVQAIWDSIAEHPETVPITDAQRAEIDRRLARHERDPQTLTWEEVKDRLLKNLPGEPSTSGSQAERAKQMDKQ